MAVWRAPPMWQGGTCWIIGGGPSVPRQFGVPEDVIQKVESGALLPSAYSRYMERIHEKHVIGINNAYQIGTWIDVLFFGDASWFLCHRRRIALFPGLKVTCNPRFHNKKVEDADGIKFLARDREHRKGISSDPTKVSWNSNSGCAVISLARHFGVVRIVLLGFDMTLDQRGVSHWHGFHKEKGDKPVSPPFGRHRKGFQPIAQDAQQMGIEIFNASPDSTIDCLPKVSVQELL